MPVVYSQVPAKIGTDKETGLPQVNCELVSTLQRTKFKDWEYEDEMRVYVQLDHEVRECGLYFYPFDEHLVLTEVVLGPRCELPSESLRALLGSYSRPVAIKNSTLASRKFEVVEHTLRPHTSA